MASRERWKPVASEWLASGEVVRIANRIGRFYGLAAEDREDVVQETRIALWMAKADGPVGISWIERVATNKAVDRVRAIMRARSGDQAFALLECRNRSPIELQHLLRARLAGLPERLREFYELHYIAGWSERELAKQLALCRKSVRSLDQRCRRALLGSAQRIAPPQSRGAA